MSFQFNKIPDFPSAFLEYASNSNVQGETNLYWLPDDSFMSVLIVFTSSIWSKLQFGKIQWNWTEITCLMWVYVYWIAATLNCASSSSLFNSSLRVARSFIAEREGSNHQHSTQVQMMIARIAFLNIISFMIKMKKGSKYRSWCDPTTAVIYRQGTLWTTELHSSRQDQKVFFFYNML